MVRTSTLLATTAILAGFASPSLAQVFTAAELYAMDAAEPRFGRGYDLPGDVSFYPALNIAARAVRSETPSMSLVLSPEVAVFWDLDPYSIRILADVDIIPIGVGREGRITSANLSANVSRELGTWRVSFDTYYSRFVDGNTGTDTPPVVQAYGATATLEGPVGPIGLRASIGVDRTQYGDAAEGGVPVDPSARNQTAFDASLRASLNFGGMFTPYVEIAAERRIHDQPLDEGGLLQNGTTLSGRGGIIFDNSPALRAEVAVGYFYNMPDEPTVTALRGLIIDADVTWSPRDRISIAFGLETRHTDDPNLGEGGAVRREWTLRGTYAAREELVIGIGGNYVREVAANGDINANASVGIDATWQPWRWLALTGSVTRNIDLTPDPGATGRETVFSITARLQR